MTRVGLGRRRPIFIGAWHSTSKYDMTPTSSGAQEVMAPALCIQGGGVTDMKSKNSGGFSPARSELTLIKANNVGPTRLKEFLKLASVPHAASLRILEHDGNNVA